MARAKDRRYKPIIPTLQACEQAAEMLRRAGFEHAGTSKSTTTAYYRFPGRTGLLRVAEHKYKRGGASGESSLLPVVAKLTFAGDHVTREGTMRLSQAALEGKVCGAIGRYMLATGEPLYVDGHLHRLALAGGVTYERPASGLPDTGAAVAAMPTLFEIANRK